MYTVSVQAHYDAAHFLEQYKGKCERLHGHRYVVEAVLQTEELNQAGIAFDFVEVKGRLRELADGLDHTNLNDHPAFRGVETSAENQARYFFDQLKKGLPQAQADGLLYVRVWETPTQWAAYGEPGIAPSTQRPAL